MRPSRRRTNRVHGSDASGLTHIYVLHETGDAGPIDPGAFTRPVQLHLVPRLLQPNPRTGELPDLMEFICLEDNEYGRAASIQVGAGTDGKK